MSYLDQYKTEIINGIQSEVVSLPELDIFKTPFLNQKILTIVLKIKYNKEDLDSNLLNKFIQYNFTHSARSADTFKYNQEIIPSENVKINAQCIITEDFVFFEVYGALSLDYDNLTIIQKEKANMAGKEVGEFFYNILFKPIMVLLQK